MELSDDDINARPPRPAAAPLCARPAGSGPQPESAKPAGASGPPAHVSAGPSPTPPCAEGVGLGLDFWQEPPDGMELSYQDIDARPLSSAAGPLRAQLAGAVVPPAQVSAGPSPPPPRGEAGGRAHMTRQEPIHRDEQEPWDQIGRAHV